MIKNRQEIANEDSTGAVAQGLTDEDLLVVFPNCQPVLPHEIEREPTEIEREIV